MSAPTLPLLLPALPDCIEGVVGSDPWRVQCQECAHIGTGATVMAAIRDGGVRFHWPPWPDGTNPRLCRECRQARGCDCDSCRDERGGR